ncbi:peptidoglycan-binding domain-containing protein [Streptomyces indicus]|uniref:Putative peptidoglycan binding domain-containing protein n=1 Tax=Streptomyces indicus TaxID=417292 RepID=A0A1G8XRL3_9ACTN|nr:peptidoglycan-binding protein [Streptomyces indicus]SDJ93133.1 Putative peptidoglycan binding domain-containing protein [Streptomyces indicus]
MRSLRLKAGLAAAAVTAGTLGLLTTTAAEARPGAPTLNHGSSGSGVWCVQRIINLNYGEVLEEDAKYGSYTKAWVKRFQEDFKVKPYDGVVGKKTGNALLNSVGGDSYCYKHLPTTR